MKFNQKKIGTVILSFLILFTFSCNEEETVNIKGQALNTKAGAIVNTHNKMYFIDGLKSWDKEYLEKDIIVEGVLKVEEYTFENATNTNGEYNQTAISNKYIILSADWKLDL